MNYKRTKYFTKSSLSILVTIQKKISPSWWCQRKGYGITSVSGRSSGHLECVYKISSPIDTFASQENTASATKKIKNPVSSIGTTDKINPCYCEFKTVSFLVLWINTLWYFKTTQSSYLELMASLCFDASKRFFVCISFVLKQITVRCSVTHPLHRQCRLYGGVRS